MEKKRFLLLAPTAFGLHDLIVNNLEYLGFDVVSIQSDGYPFRYRSIYERLYNWFRKTFFNDRSYKEKLRSRRQHELQHNILKEHSAFDYGLVIRADLFPEDLIKACRLCADKLISFHFDGISRNVEVLHYAHYFDRFYVFEEEDVTRYPTYNLQYSPNFYFDYPESIGLDSIERYEVYYVSTFHESRVQQLVKLYHYLQSFFERVRFVVVCQPQNVPLASQYVGQKMELTIHGVSFDAQLQHIATSQVIIDLVITEHRGFSFRILEGIKYGKKVITSNPRVREADFYHPNNYFILTEDNWEEIEAFLQLPFVPLHPVVRERYSFTHWLTSKFTEL